MTSPQPTPATPASTDKQSQAATLHVIAQNQTTLNQGTLTTQVTHTTATGVLSTTKRDVGPSSKTTAQSSKTAQLGQHTTSTTLQSSKTGEKRGSCVLWWSSF